MAGGGRAADVGQCGVPQQMTAWLKAEGQHPVACGNRHISKDMQPNGKEIGVDKEAGLIFTAADHGQVGYRVQADQPPGGNKSATKMCITDRMQNGTEIE